ncbi:hypothetical protein [Micromonospora yangpuensis]|uniref:Tetratricopeptide repeat-containing protein n=1 Tax=Micromonospora yangpuensis TaxID=683228 RepID=A0A1C6UA12_9ACTN|nr:hypothetical protein [Micromonospora yangpuensis]GGL88197.1 hypothetical protein GCM10012279_02350 [Micromonospora yangpuensis]SCL50741.1 hypothetical protein GA0070617_1579 [Micromonospora yangpuensis]
MGLRQSRARGDAIAAAVSHAVPGTDEWGTAMIAKCAYEVNISRYAAAVRTSRQLREWVERGAVDPRFECGALTHEGTALFTSFQDLAEAERLLRRAVTFAPAADTDVRVARWLATAFHYLGRIAEARGRDVDCLHHYLRGQEYQQLCPEEIEANAFLQLRLSEPLANAHLFELAYDHLRRAEKLATTGANRGSAAVQVELGHATLTAKQVVSPRPNARGSRRCGTAGRSGSAGANCSAWASCSRSGSSADTTYAPPGRWCGSCRRCSPASYGTTASSSSARASRCSSGWPSDGCPGPTSQVAGGRRPPS